MVKNVPVTNVDYQIRYHCFSLVNCIEYFGRSYILMWRALFFTALMADNAVNAEDLGLSERGLPTMQILISPNAPTALI